MVITNSVDYVRWTQTTAVYLEKTEPDEDAKSYYEVLGLIDEVGEVAGILKRQIRDNVPFDRDKFGLELGDIAWYLARIHYDHADLPLDHDNPYYPLAIEMKIEAEVKGLTCFDIAILICERLKRHFLTKDDAARFMFGGRPANLEQLIKQAHHGFTREDALGMFVTRMYKRISEDVPSVGILMHLVSEANSMEAIFDWCALCYKYNYLVLDVLQDNVNKLESRKERGTLHGKGSER